MSPVTHFLFGWMVANTTESSRRERAMVTIAGVIPDADGLGLIPELLTRGAAPALPWFTLYHHTLHNGTFALFTALVAFALAKRRWKTAALVLLSFHLHLLCDLAGARGPDGYQWPIPYLSPWSRAWDLTWQGQWALNAWPNFAITGALLAATFYLAWRRGFSPLEILSLKLDQAFVAALRARFSRRVPVE